MIVAVPVRPRGCSRRAGRETVTGRPRRSLGLKLTALLVMLALFVTALLVGVARGFV